VVGGAAGEEVEGGEVEAGEFRNGELAGDEAPAGGVSVAVDGVSVVVDEVEAVVQPEPAAPSGSGVSVPAPEPDGSVEREPVSQAPAVEDTVAKAGIPTPAMLGRKRASEVVLPSAEPTWSTSTGNEPVVDEHGVFNPELIDTVARAVIASWCRTATPETLLALREAKPMIPGELDRALLHDLSSRAGVYDIDDASRHEVRERFWFHVARIRLA